MDNNGLYYGKEAKVELKTIAEEVLRNVQDDLLNDLNVDDLLTGNEKVAIRLAKLHGAKEFVDKLFGELLKEEEADE